MTDKFETLITPRAPATIEGHGASPNWSGDHTRFRRFEDHTRFNNPGSTAVPTIRRSHAIQRSGEHTRLDGPGEHTRLACGGRRPAGHGSAREPVKRLSIG